MAKIKVNILNHGKFFGMTTPVYGIEIDTQVYDMLKMINVRVEPYVEPKKPEVVAEEEKPTQKVEIREVTEPDGRVVIKPVIIDLETNEVVDPVADKQEDKVTVTEEVKVEETPAVEEEVADDVTLESLDPREMNPLYYIKKCPKKCTKDFYFPEDLADFTRKELLCILNYRGHYSKRTGARDALAAKFHDSKDVIIGKIIKTNKTE